MFDGAVGCRDVELDVGRGDVGLKKDEVVVKSVVDVVVFAVGTGSTWDVVLVHIGGVVETTDVVLADTVLLAGTGVVTSPASYTRIEFTSQYVSLNACGWLATKASQLG